MGANPRPPALDTAPVNKLIWTFSLPAICSQVVSSMNNIVDQTFMGWGSAIWPSPRPTWPFPCLPWSRPWPASSASAAPRGTASSWAGETRPAPEKPGQRRGLGGGGGPADGRPWPGVFRAHALPLRGHRGHDALRPALYLRPPLGVPFGIFATAMAHVIRADGGPRYSVRSCSPGPFSI